LFVERKISLIFALMKKILLYLFIGISVGKSYTALAQSVSDTTKQKKNKERVITSVVENSTAPLTVKDAQVFDIQKQDGLIRLTIVVRDVETKTFLTRVQLRVRNATTGEPIETTFNRTDNSFQAKVLPETVVRIYVTAKGYTDASANINDIKDDRNIPFELQKIKPSIVKIRILSSINDRPIQGSVLKVKTQNSGDTQTLNLKEGSIELSYDAAEVLDLSATAEGYSTTSKKVEVETDLRGKTYDVFLKLERNAVTTPPPPPPSVPAVVEKPVDTKSFGILQKGKAITLNNIYFDQSSPVLRTESAPQLDELVEVLKQNPTLRVEIRGHTDNVGDFDLNVKLSRERCQSVVDYLIKKGIEANRLQTLGRGPVDAVAPNTTEENRKKNRRVEFVVL
jgi:outer membrane protein OmpA-like peptidoglycan-associated protein